MKSFRLLSIVGIFLSVISISIMMSPVSAESFTTEGVVYDLVEGGGDYYAEASAYDGESQEVVMKSVIVYEGIEYPVILIEDDIFNILSGTSSADTEKRANIVSVTIEDNDQLLLPSSMLEGLKNLESVTVGEGITELPVSFCYGCSKLAEVVLPSSIERIGSSAFAYDKLLTSVTLGENVLVIMEAAFMGCESLTEITIPDKVTAIGARAFSQCYNLSNVVIGNESDLESIGITAFGESLITTIFIPSKVSTIEIGGGTLSTFSEKLEEAIVSDDNGTFFSSDGVIYNKSDGSLFYYPPAKSGALTIDFNPGFGLFFGNSGISKVIFLDGVDNVGMMAFFMCSSLSEVVMSDTITTMDMAAFGLCHELSKVTLSQGIKTIPNGAFQEACIETIDLSNVTTIDGNAFCGCTDLVIKELPSGLVSLGPSSFYNCSKVSVSSLPPGILELGPSTFWNTGAMSMVVGEWDNLKLTTESGCPIFGGSCLKSITLDNVTVDDTNVRNVFDFSISPALGEVVFGARFSNEDFIASTFDALVSAYPDKVVESVIEDGVTTLVIRDRAVGDIAVVDGIQYTLTSTDPMECSVTGFEAGITALAIPESVEFWGVAAAVKSVGAKAFYGCDTLVSADLGNVTSVGIKAFAWCSKLKSVDAGDSLKTISAYAFYRCVRLADINLDDSAKTLKVYGSYSFYKCGKLSSIIVPSFMTTIGTKAFTLTFADENGDPLEASIGSLKGYEYSNVDGVLVRQAGPEIGSEFMSDKLVFRVSSALPNEVEVVGYSGKITSLDLSEDVTDGEFTYSVTAIGKNAFYKCRTLTSANLGNVEVIGSKAFYGCSKLASLKADSIVTIGIKAFADCSVLADLELGNSLKTVSAYAFYRCTSLTSFDAPDSLTTIGSYAFYKCSALTTVHTGSSLKTIGSKAFVLTDLSEIDFPAVLKTVKSAAFDGYELLDKDASPIDATAENLRGHSFSGDGATLRTYT